MRRSLPLALLVIASLLTTASSVSAASDTCDQQFAALNDRFSAAYINLDAECYPSEPSDVTASCGFEISPECQERYDALAQETGEAYNAFYEQCPDFLTPIAVDVTPIDGSPPIMYIGQRTSTGPVLRAPTKKEMLTKIRTLKKQLRRSQAKNKKIRSRCAK